MDILRVAGNTLFFFFLLFAAAGTHLSFADEIQSGFASNAKNLDTSDGLLHISPEILKGLNEEQRKWYEKFNEGVLFFDGWRSISQDILSHFPPEKRVEVRKYIQRLGILIGTEWSKENDVRCIDNKKLGEWGDRIKDAIREGSTEGLTVALKSINDEVECLLRKSRNGEYSLNLASPDE
ncbi:hypothetical protein [Desulfomarina profundi]|uniref:hypothetical protein n=1 Tax=Desulfomarina profundi TaxID=2772557 RepID=UPI001E305F6C|nr:hypothetical protein [Desulfomarina profundi]